MTSTTTGHPAPAGGGGIWSAAYAQMTFAFLTVIALVAFGGLSVVAALSSIAEDLGQVGLLPWVITGYLAAASISVILAGPVIDAIGVRRTFRITGIWFFLSSAAAAAAPSMPLLITARSAQGFGGGLVFAVALSAIGLGYPHELRPRAFAAQSIVWGTLGLGSPAIAGALLALGGWRIIFLVQLPLAALALTAGWNRLPTTRERPARIQTDWVGSGLLAALIITSLAAVNQIGVRWAVVAVALGLTALIAAAYWRHSGRAPTPVLSRGHITRFPLRWVHVTSGLVMTVALGLDTYLPLYVQTTRGRSVEFAAFSLLYVTGGWTTGSLIYSRLLTKRRESDSVLLGSLTIIPATAGAGLSIALDWPLIVLFLSLGLVGISVGMSTTAGLTLIQASSAPEEMGRVTAAHQFVRQLSITYGVALAGAILFLVVDLRVGDIDSVRDVISGEEIALGTETRDAIGEGLAWISVATAVLAVVALATAVSLSRRTRAGSAVG